MSLVAINSWRASVLFRPFPVVCFSYLHAVAFPLNSHLYCVLPVGMHGIFKEFRRYSLQLSDRVLNVTPFIRPGKLRAASQRVV